MIRIYSFAVIPSPTMFGDCCTSFKGYCPWVLAYHAQGLASTITTHGGRLRSLRD